MATMIMYHPCVKSEAGASNEVVLKLNRAAREAAIGDSRFSAFSPESILIEWATIITKDVEQRRKQANLARPDLESVTATLNHTLSLVSAMAEDLRATKQQNFELLTKVSTLVGVFDNSNMEQHQLTEKLAMICDVVQSTQKQQDTLLGKVQKLDFNAAVSTAKLSMLKTPDQVSMRKRSYDNMMDPLLDLSTTLPSFALAAPTLASPAPAPTVAAPPSLVATNSVVLAPAASARSAPVIVDLTGEKQQPKKLMDAFQAMDKVSMVGAARTTTSITKSWLLRNVLMFYRKQLKPKKLWDVQVTGKEFAEPWCVRNCLELIAKAATAEELEAFVKKGIEDKEALTMATKLEKAGDLMLDLEWEGLEGGVKENSGKKLTYMAVGHRVQNHKLECIAKRGMAKAKADNQPLVFLSEVANECEIVLSPGQQQITAMFAPRKKAGPKTTDDDSTSDALQKHLCQRQYGLADTPEGKVWKEGEAWGLCASYPYGCAGTKAEGLLLVPASGQIIFRYRCTKCGWYMHSGFCSPVPPEDGDTSNLLCYYCSNGEDRHM
jgi:hypothetical protein